MVSSVTVGVGIGVTVCACFVGEVDGESLGGVLGRLVRMYSKSERREDGRVVTAELDVWGGFMYLPAVSLSLEVLVVVVAWSSSVLMCLVLQFLLLGYLLLVVFNLLLLTCYSCLVVA